MSKARKTPNVYLVRGDEGSVARYLSKQVNIHGPVLDPVEAVRLAKSRFITGTMTILVSDPKVVKKIPLDQLNGTKHKILLVQGTDRSKEFRHFARKLEIVYCDPPQLYQHDLWQERITALANGVGIRVGDVEVSELFRLCGGDEAEIERALKVAFHAGCSPLDVVALTSAEGLIQIVDNLLRHQWMSVAQNLQALRDQGVNFYQIAAALITRTKRILRVRAQQDMQISEEMIKAVEGLPRFLAGNFLSEARMNTSDGLCNIIKTISGAQRMGDLGNDHLFAIAAGAVEGV